MSTSGEYMKVLIQNVETGFFFKAPGQWVQDPVEAQQFRSGIEARQTGNTCAEQTVLYYAFADARFDFVIDMRPRTTALIGVAGF